MNEFVNKDEREIIESCIRGKAHSQELLFKKYYGMMLGICLRYCNNKSDAHDILQEGFVKVFKNLAHFKFEGPFIAWMKKIFVNTAIDHYRKNLLFPEPVDIDNQSELIEEDHIFDNLDRNDILKCLNEMPTGYRTVFNLYVIEGYSHKEIAEKLGINEGTSKSQFSKSRKYLRAMIEKRFF